MPEFTYAKYQLKVNAPGQFNDLELELFCYKIGHSKEKGGLGRAGHFRKIAEMLWHPKSPKHFVWHPWAEKMNEVCHEHPLTGAAYPHVAISGCGSSGKTDFMAVYAIINWLCSPISTLVLCTSTDLKASRKRIWGSIVQYYQAISKIAPGKLTDSMGMIRTDTGSGTFSDKQGISLVAGEKKKEQEAMAKLIGAKNDRVFLLADELCELTQALLDTTYSNLSTNPFYQVIGASNFKSRLDPFGVLYAPKDGYDLVDTVNLEEWETEKGWALHFDGLKSPNILEGKDTWPIYGSKQLQAHKKDLGENTALFWRMCRSAETPLGIENIIYSDSDFAVGKAYLQPTWLSEYTPIAAMDPSFSSGGDRCVLYFGKYGMAVDTERNTTHWVLCFDNFRLLREDVSLLKDRLRSYQIADQVMEHCRAKGVKPENFAMDTTASGALADVIGELWSHDILRVNFSGAATERPVTADGIPAREQFVNRVSEIWFVGHKFMQFGQIKGLIPSTARELKGRQYESVKSVHGLRVVVESKRDMKGRLMFSPDEADSALILLDLCRERFGFTAAGVPQEGSSNNSWKRKAAQLNEVYETAAGFDYSMGAGVL